MTDYRGAGQAALITVGIIILVAVLSIFNIGEGGADSGRADCVENHAHYGLACE